eukprot:CAMPEP_0178389334 /NCGR_PEP_ID=MMETSP0689_2-20121128/10062_1 /TAXON_ID=160604 /ORGANISM="Amphidinium massartii, Strain CS-259" /LENGTH=667 /DNA_ID=CAMNT_0020009779 /DNA_START=47 /DNA_END=2051 /DNA_ORIENTATION=+
METTVGNLGNLRAMEMPSRSDELQGASSRPTKLFLGGITRNTTTKHLRDHFSQHGRVLDCIAMRQLDGRPRGFGYVTLDSPEAAHRCVVEPQIIDGRVIDVKQAIPEGNNAMKDDIVDPMMAHAQAAGYGMMPSDSWHGGSVLDSWWMNAQDCQRHPASSQYDCVSMLSRGHSDSMMWPLSTTPMAMDSPPMSSLDIMAQELDMTSMSQVLHSTSRHEMQIDLDKVWSDKADGLHMGTHSRWSFAPGSEMCASAPEFIPTVEKSGSELQSGVLSTSSQALAAAKKRAPLGEITNLAGAENVTEVSEGKLGDVLLCSMAAEFEAGSPAANDSLPLDSSIFIDVDDSADATTVSPETSPIEEPSIVEEPSRASESCAGTSSCNNSSNSDDEDDEELAIPGDGDAAAGSQITDFSKLPSIGSVMHSVGQCKRCNFFSKGRCNNGYDCSFCHFPHEKRKPSRQEKRERKAAWMAQHSTEEPEMDINLADPLGLTQPLPAMYVLPNKVLSASELAEALTSQSATKCALEGPALPPGLPLPMNRGDGWQPEGEVSPAPTASCSLGMPMGPTLSSDCCLSTTPVGSVFTGVVSQQLCTTPMQAAPAATSSSSPVKCTIGTQTEDHMVAPFVQHKLLQLDVKPQGVAAALRAEDDASLLAGCTELCALTARRISM